VLAAAKREAEKAGIGLEQFLTIWCVRGSQGLHADWIKPGEMDASAGAAPKPDWVAVAGFANRWEAQNEGCYERNAHEFSGGKRKVATV